MHSIKFALYVFLLLFASSVFGNTYYVRTDGGTPTQCSGLVNAAYSGNILNRSCAWSNPLWVFPPNIDGGDPANKPLIAGGDTLIIGQGSYQMGMPLNLGNWSSCNVNWQYDCHAQPVPSGTAASPTRIMGANYANCSSGTSAPQLWGSGGSGSVLNLTGSSNVLVECLEITDHSNCIQNQADASVKCLAGGLWAANGITDTDGKADNIPSTNVTLQDVNIHGMAKYGVLAGNISGWTVNHVKINANGFGGFSTDLSPAYSVSSGSNTFTNVEIAWNGCAENYPASTIWGCWGQQTGGYGDGVGSSSASDRGTWTFQDVAVSNNTQDGLDFLHADPSAVITFDRVNAQRNAGNQLKTNGTATISNSIVNGYCASFVGVGDMQGNNSAGGGTSGDICRAQGDTIVVGQTPGLTTTIDHNTVISEGNDIVTVPGTGPGDKTSKLVISNNILIGQPDWVKGDQKPQPLADVWWWGDGTPVNTPTLTNNVIWNTKSGAGTVDPKLVNETLAAFDATPTAATPPGVGAIQTSTPPPPPVMPPPTICPAVCVPKVVCTQGIVSAATCTATCQ